MLSVSVPPRFVTRVASSRAKEITCSCFTVRRTDSVNNTGKQMLWLPTSRAEKYKAKQAIDTFFVRSGDMLAAAVVFLGTNMLTLGVAGFARVNIAVVLIALGVAVLLLREYRRVTAPAAGQRST